MVEVKVAVDEVGTESICKKSLICCLRVDEVLHVVMI